MASSRASLSLENHKSLVECPSTQLFGGEDGDSGLAAALLSHLSLYPRGQPSILAPSQYHSRSPVDPEASEAPMGLGVWPGSQSLLKTSECDLFILKMSC